MSYFRYAERSADTQINWAEIGKNMSDMLKEEVQLREDKKAAIDKATREYGEELANAPTGDYDAGNTFALEFAGNAQEFRLMQDRLLKSGQLKVKDYTIGRQNAIDGTSNLFGLAEEYQKEYSDKMTRWDGDESSFREVWEMEQAEGLANLRQVKGYLNPTNGVVSIGKMVKNPKTGVMEMSKKPNEFATVNELRQRLKQKYNRFDLNGTASKAAAQLGALEQSAVQIGGSRQLNTIITMIDAKQHDFGLEGEKFAATYKEWEKTQVSAMMRNGNDIASVLTDKVLQTETGDKYTFTFDKKEFDADKTGSLIYLDRSENPAGTPVFKEGQKEKVEEELKLAIRANIDVKRQTQGAGFTPQSRSESAVEFANAERNRNQDTALNNFGKLFYGSEADKFEAANNLRALNSKIEAIEPTTDGIIIRYTESSGLNDEKLPYGTDQSRFIKQGVNFVLAEGQKIQNVDDILSRSKYQENLNKKLGATTFTPSKGIAKPTRPTYNDAYMMTNEANFDNIALTELASTVATETDEATLESRVKNELLKIEGITSDDISTSQFTFGQGVIVTFNGKKYELDLKNPKAFKDQVELLEAAAIKKGIQGSLLLDKESKKAYIDNFQTKRRAFEQGQNNTEAKPTPAPAPAPRGNNAKGEE